MMPYIHKIFDVDPSTNTIKRKIRNAQDAEYSWLGISNQIDGPVGSVDIQNSFQLKSNVSSWYREYCSHFWCWYR